jgi:hypothetical protein
VVLEVTFSEIMRTCSPPVRLNVRCSSALHGTGPIQFHQECNEQSKAATRTMRRQHCITGASSHHRSIHDPLQPPLTMTALLHQCSLSTTGFSLSPVVLQTILPVCGIRSVGPCEKAILSFKT